MLEYLYPIPLAALFGQRIGYQLPHRGDDLIFIRDNEMLHYGTKRYRHIQATDSDWRSLETPKYGFIGDYQRYYFSRGAAGLAGFINYYQPSGLGDGRDNRSYIQWDQSPGIDHFQGNPIVL